MEWNNGKERALFNKEQAKLRKQYLAAGMTEEQIQAMHVFDAEWYKNRRREAVHTQRLDIQTSEDEDINKDNPLYKKFFEKLAVKDNHADYSRFGWIEEIENEELVKAVIALSDIDKELITLLMNGFNQDVIALLLGMTQPAVSQYDPAGGGVLPRFYRQRRSAGKLQGASGALYRCHLQESALAFCGNLRGRGDHGDDGQETLQLYAHDPRL